MKTDRKYTYPGTFTGSTQGVSRQLISVCKPGSLLGIPLERGQAVPGKRAWSTWAEEDEVTAELAAEGHPTSPGRAELGVATPLQIDDPPTPFSSYVA